MIVSGVVVLVAAGIALKRPIIEQWYVWQLESGGEAEKKVALERLEEMGSVKAVPHFLELILDAQVSETTGPTTGGYFKASVRLKILDVPKPVNLSVKEAFLDVVSEIVGSEYARPHFIPGLDSLAIAQSRTGVEAILQGLDTLKRIRAVLERIGVDAVPQLNKVLKAENTERLVELVADLELRLLIDQLKIEEDIRSLTRILANENMVPEVRGHVIVAIGEIGEEATPAVPLLIEALRAENPQNRMYAADALRYIGTGARAATSSLRTLSENDEAHYVRRAAAEALRAIEGDKESEA